MTKTLTALLAAFTLSFALAGCDEEEAEIETEEGEVEVEEE